MFVPRHYEPPSGEHVVEVVRKNALALLVSAGTAGMSATHLPVVPESRDYGNGTDSLVGATLLGHMNRANPHWKTLTTGSEGLLVFQGPNAYICPSVYETSPVAPTWNFVSVHLRGTIEIIEGAEQTMAVIKHTVEFLDNNLGHGWDMTDSMGYFERILPGVGAFRFQVESADSMFKLSQDMPPSLREKICHRFEESNNPHANSLVEHMRAALPH
ncbi:FMN-binding negative transcriptional regulator [Nocardia abscessus]|uniref:FMN-binding negative transcriptional regulator n=1 Tax=Nocardia abscessus TaxID=120957 RepID=UPI002453DA48|nr:FMN-binding negative transcriptional regulator [Nocardia abscessus]